MTIKFENGYRTTYTGLFGGNYTVEVVDRTADTVTLRSFWIAEDTGEECHSDTVYDVEVENIASGIDCERIVVWEYRDYYGYVYAMNEDNRFYVHDHGMLPPDDDAIDDEYVDPYEDAFIRTYGNKPFCNDYSPSAPWNAPGMSVHDFI